MAVADPDGAVSQRAAEPETAGRGADDFLRSPLHLPLLEPSTAEGFDREAVFLEYVEEHRDSHKSIPPWRAVRTARYGYAITRDGPWLLFDLEDDPHELTNRVGDAEYSETRSNLHRRLVAHLRAIEDPFERTYTYE